MKRYPLTYAEWGWREYISVITSFFADYSSDLEGKIQAIYPDSDIALLNSARGGLRLIIDRLIALNPEKKEVIVPNYICPSVTDTLASMGVSVIYAPVGSNLNVDAEAIGPLIGQETLAVIAVHMYGCVAQIEAIAQLCEESGVVLIDDAAQLGVKLPGNVCPGSYGDFGLVSFAQSKSIVTGVRGSGGVLLINNPKWTDIFKDKINGLKPGPARRLQFFYFLGQYQFVRVFGKLVYYLERLSVKSGLSRNDYYSVQAISNLDAAIACHQYDSAEQRILNKINVIQWYSQHLEGCSFIQLPQAESGSYLSRLFVQFNLTDERYRQLRVCLAAENIGARNGYPSTKCLMELPLSSKMNEADVVVVVTALKKCLSRFDEQVSASKHH